MPYVKVYIHFVWSTKNRDPFLFTKEIRLNVWEHIKKNAKSKGIFIDTINGYNDHCHCLISLGVDQNIRQIMQLIKGESSFWINKEAMINPKFEWQDEYFAASVSESLIERTRNYIKGQEEHHQSKTYQQEYDDFLQKCGFQKFSDRIIEHS
jgi:putative transposase